MKVWIINAEENQAILLKIKTYFYIIITYK